MVEVPENDTRGCTITHIATFVFYPAPPSKWEKIRNFLLMTVASFLCFFLLIVVSKALFSRVFPDPDPIPIPPPPPTSFLNPGDYCIVKRLAHQQLEETVDYQTSSRCQACDEYFFAFLSTRFHGLVGASFVLDYNNTKYMEQVAYLMDERGNFGDCYVVGEECPAPCESHLENLATWLKEDGEQLVISFGINRHP